MHVLQPVKNPEKINPVATEGGTTEFVDMASEIFEKDMIYLQQESMITVYLNHTRKSAQLTANPAIRHSPRSHKCVPHQHDSISDWSWGSGQNVEVTRNSL